jgi:membrane-bound metal-dependent hydrolase YbcI (DUF457 family)
MPSPVGHALAGLAAGWLVDGAPALSGLRVKERALSVALGFAALGAAPDLDLLVGAHSRQTHSVGASLLVGLAVAVVWRRWRLGVATAAAWGSHVLLDWLGTDGTPPIGVMALWPWSNGFYESSAHLFLPIERRWWLAHFVSHNLRALIRELLILVPVVVVAWWWRRGTRSAEFRVQNAES